MSPRTLAALAVIVAPWAPRPAPAATAAERPSPPAVRRLALVAGANDGGAGRVRLRHAVSDAQKVARVLQQLGGVAAEDEAVLFDPAEPALRAALAELAGRVARARGTSPRVEAIFYYSGHSDEEGLLVRGARIPFDDLRAWLDALGADVRIAVIDSCASGSFTRGKGGARVAPFLVDSATRVTGRAILTSSSADEASQESDRLGASFFTAALLTGLRGAADMDHDGRVTLSEAYQYAFQDTLARTERTRAGPQHPEWDLQLVGAGEVVLTDLRGSAASLYLPEEAQGRIFLRDGAGRLVAEVRKLAGQPLELGLDPGRYQVVVERDGKLQEAQVEVRAGAPTPFPTSGFTAVGREQTAVRGNELEPLEERFVDVALFPPVSTNGDRPVVNRLQLALVGSRTTRLSGVGLGPVLWAEEDVRGAHLAWIASSAGGRLEGLQLAGMAGIAGELRGIQASSFFNLVRRDATGLQLSGGASWTSGALTGSQVSIVNRAGQLAGGQLGLVNVAGDVRGLQLGLVNVARRVEGLQLGLVNLADSVDGAPVGLVSLVRDGEHKVLLLGDETGMAAAELLLGSRKVHGLLRAGVQRTTGGARTWLGAGLGVHLVHGPFLLDLDGLAQSAPAVEQENLLATVRALGGWQVRPWLAVVAGPSASGFWSEGGFDPALGGAFRGRLGRGRAWLGFQAGLRLGP